MHGKHHIAPGIAQSEIAIRDVLDCREELEGAFDMIIRGMAYPDSGIVRLHTGTDYAEIRSYLKSLGILYSRSLSADNNSFMLPTDFYNWIPTAKHTNKDLFKWVDEFLALDASKLVESYEVLDGGLSIKLEPIAAQAQGEYFTLAFAGTAHYFELNFNENEDENENYRPDGL